MARWLAHVCRKSWNRKSDNPARSTAFSKFAKLSELPINHQLTSQGGQDNDPYFILRGSVRVLVNSREVATRRPGQHIGEMALIDLTAVRSATVITAEASVVAKVSEPDFTRVANSHPMIWRKLAGTLRNAFANETAFIQLRALFPRSS